MAEPADGRRVGFNVGEACGVRPPVDFLEEAADLGAVACVVGSFAGASVDVTGCWVVGGIESAIRDAYLEGRKSGGGYAPFWQP